MCYIDDKTREETFIADMDKEFFDGLTDDDRYCFLMYLRSSENLSNEQRELITDKLGLELVG